MRLAWVVLAVGCADVPDSDLDGDGIADAADDCISGFADEPKDADGDGKDATVDLCPLDANAVAGDLDFDGIPEACDPFPAEGARPDTRRCVTSFAVPWMNASYLVGRAGEASWEPRDGLRASATDTVSLVSIFEKQYRSTTYDVLATTTGLTASSDFRMYVRADPDQVSNKDVACGVDNQNLYVWADNGKHALVPLPAPVTDAFRLRATINPTIVLCRVTIGAQSMATTYAVTAPRGVLGFRTQGIDITIDTLVTDSNDSAPPI